MSILDRFRSAPAPPPEPQGYSGRNHFAGYLQLEELNFELQGRQGLAVFDRMYRTDADCKRAIAMVVNPIVGGTWSVEPYGGDNASDLDKQIAEAVHWALFEYMNPSLAEHLGEAVPLFARSGFAPFEQVWDSTDYNGQKLLLPCKLDVRLPRSIVRWFEDDRANLTALEQLVTGGGSIVRPNTAYGLVRIDAANLTYYRVGSEGDNWEGVSLLRPAYKHWYIKDKVERLDAIAQEREATGIPVLYPPQGFSDQTILEDMEEALAGLRAGEETVIRMPGPKQGPGVEPGQGWLLEILGLGATGEGGTRSAAATLTYHGDKIAAAVIAEFMRLGQRSNGSGSRATAGVQENPFHAGVEAIAGIPERALQPLVNRIVALNWAAAKGAPKLKMEKADSTSLAELASFVSGLVGSGIMQADEPLEDFLRERADLPPADPAAREQKRQQDAQDRELEVVSREAALEQAKATPPAEVAKAKTAAELHPGDTFNWVEDAGGLPRKIHELKQDLEQDGHPTSEAVAIAVSQAKKFCAKGHADWCDAVAEWDEKRAEAKVTHAGRQYWGASWHDDPDTYDAPVPIAVGDAVRASSPDLSLGRAGVVEAKRVAEADGSVIYDVRWSDGEREQGVREWTLRNVRSFARQDRELRWYEQHMSLDTIEQAIDGARDQFKQGAAPHIYAIASQVTSQLMAGDDPDVDTGPLADELHAQLSALYRTGRVTVREELARQRGQQYAGTFAGSDLPATLRQRAEAAAAAIVAAVVGAARRLVVGGRHPTAKVQQAAEAAGAQGLRAEALLHAAAALNEGRSDEANDHADEIVGSRYTSILDQNRCTRCAKADDDVLRPLSDPVRLQRIPPNPDCEGGDRCRCMEFFQLTEEAAPSFTDPKPAAAADAFAFNPDELRDEHGRWTKAGLGKLVEHLFKTSFEKVKTAAARRYGERGAAVAEDAAQHAFLQLAAGKMPPEHPNPEAWLIVVAQHEAHRMLTLHSASRTQSLDAILERPTRHEPTDRRADPEFLAEINDSIQLLKKLIPAQQTVLFHLWAGYSYKELEEKLGVTFTWIDRHAKEGRKELRKLRGEGGES